MVPNIQKDKITIGNDQRWATKLVKSVSHLPYREIVNEYDQEIPQSQTADNPVAP